MATLEPAIIKDTIELINHYKTNLAFRERFDAAIRRNINVTYKHRPLKLYFEVLASSSSKYKDEYQKISRLVKHDNEELIKNTFLAVTPNDLHNLHSDAEQAQKNLNSTDYTPEEIEKINKAENEAESPEQKYKAHKERLDKTTYLTETKTPLVVEEAKEKNPEEIEDLLIPGATPEYKRSYNPASEEEKTRLMAALNQPRQEALPGELVGPGGEPFRNIPPKPEIITPAPEEKIESTPPPDNQTNLSPHTVSEKTPSTTAPTIHMQTPDLADNRRWSRIRSFFGRGATKEAGVTTITEGATIRTISTRAGVRAGARFAAGRISAGKIATKLGIRAITKTGAGFLAKLGFSAATGLATGGLGFVVGLAVIAVTTFGKQIKQLGWLMVKVTIGLVAFMFFMFFSNWGMKMNSLLPPYDVAFADPVPSVTPSISITPTITPTPTGTLTPTPTGTITPTPTDTLTPTPSITPPPGTDTVACPVLATSGISCGSFGSPYDRDCPGGHCSVSYGYCDPNERDRLIHSVDVPAARGAPVSLPTINGSSATWSFSGSIPLDPGIGGGSRLIFVSHIGDDVWILNLSHVTPSIPLSVTGSYQSATVVATIYINHVHINIGRKTPTDSDVIWLNPEDLGMCI